MAELETRIRPSIGGMEADWIEGHPALKLRQSEAGVLYVALPVDVVRNYQPKLSP
jgi:hypothetical protein